MSDNSRDKLLHAAKKLFAAKGFDGVSVREIVEAACVNVSLVSYYFGGKQGLYEACVNAYGESRLEKLGEHLREVRTVDEFRLGLRMMMLELIATQMESPELTSIVTREMEQGLPNARQVFEATVLRAHHIIADFCANAQRAGLVRPEIDVSLLAQVISGAFNQFVRVDAINLHYFKNTLTNPSYREKVVDETLSLILHGVLTDESKKRPKASRKQLS